eukprot:694561-Pyramimonas_sp.AAC.1
MCIRDRVRPLAPPCILAASLQRTGLVVLAGGLAICSRQFRLRAWRGSAGRSRPRGWPPGG